MGGKVSVRHYFAEGLTLRGYISLLPSRLPIWERIYILIGGPGTGKSTFIKTIGLELLDRGYELDFLRSANDPNALAGFILPRHGFVMLDTLKVTPLRWHAPGLIERFIDFSPFQETYRLEQRQKEVIKLQDALDEIQDRIAEEMYLEFRDQLKERLVKPFKDSPLSGSEDKARPVDEHPAPWPIAARTLAKLRRSTLHPCFLQGLTADGWLNLAPYFVAEYDQIRLEGAETLDAMDWLLREVEHLGQVVDIVLHPLDPDRILGIVFPERHLAVWQGNPECLADQGLKETLGAPLREALSIRARLQAQLKEIYSETVDFEKIDILRQQILNEILRDIEPKD